MKYQRINDLEMYGLVTGIDRKQKDKRTGKMISSRVWIFVGARSELPSSPEIMAYQKNLSFVVTVCGEYHVGDVIVFTTNGYPLHKLSKNGRIIKAPMCG